MERPEGDDEHGSPREACDERRNHLAREPRNREEQEDEEEPAGRVPIHSNLHARTNLDCRQSHTLVVQHRMQYSCHPYQIALCSKYCSH